MACTTIKKFVPALMLAATSVISWHASAHHSSAPHFDKSIDLVIENAAIVEWKFVNPHSYLYFDVTNDEGELIHWRCESTAATMLRRNGWTAETLAPGQKVTIKGEPARREDNVCSLTSITLDDGTVIGRTDNVAGVVGADIIGSVAEVAAPVDRPVKLSNGQPNISGTWLTLSFGPGSKGGEPPPNLQGSPTWGGYELTPEGLKLAENYDVRFDDPSLHCHPINIIEGWNHDQNVNEVFQYDDKIVLQYGYVDFVRTIHLNLDKHPDNIMSSTAGHSIGRWEDDVLVVDTVGFEQGLLLHQGGVHHSENMHVIERFHRDNETNELVREYAISDPDYFVGLRTGVDYMEMTDVPYVPFNCVELSGANNQRPE